MTFNRRTVLSSTVAGAAALAFPSIVRAQAGSAHVVVIGGGFGGATAARYLKARAPQVRVTLIEPAARFYTCPFSNMYLAGLRSFESLGHGFDGLRQAGIDVVQARADHVDTAKKRVLLSNGQAVSYDKLVLSPGIDMRWNAIEGYDEAASLLAPHAWKAGPQTVLLKKQLDAMPDGGKFVMVIPANPFRCPPGPYERAAMVAHYLKQHKPKSKIVLLDNKDAFSKQGLFLQGYKALYGDMIEWIKQSDDGQVVRVDAKNLEVETAFGTKYKADVLNVIPPQKAGFIADRAGVTDASGWVPIQPEDFASALVKDVYVLGDSTQAAPMPKSGFAANTQGKVAAAAIAAELTGKPLAQAAFANTCYSLIGPDYGISVAGVYRADGSKLIEVPNSGGVSPADANASYRQAEALYGAAWYKAISTDIWDR